MLILVLGFVFLGLFSGLGSVSGRCSRCSSVSGRCSRCCRSGSGFMSSRSSSRSRSSFGSGSGGGLAASSNGQGEQSGNEERVLHFISFIDREYKVQGTRGVAERVAQELFQTGSDISQQKIISAENQKCSNRIDLFEVETGRFFAVLPRILWVFPVQTRSDAQIGCCFFGTLCLPDSPEMGDQGKGCRVRVC